MISAVVALHIDFVRDHAVVFANPIIDIPVTHLALPGKILSLEWSWKALPRKTDYNLRLIIISYYYFCLLLFLFIYWTVQLEMYYQGKELYVGNTGWEYCWHTEWLSWKSRYSHISVKVPEWRSWLLWIYETGSQREKAALCYNNSKCFSLNTLGS